MKIYLWCAQWRPLINKTAIMDYFSLSWLRLAGLKHSVKATTITILMTMTMTMAATVVTTTDMATITTTMNQIKWTNTLTTIKMATGFYLDPNSQSQRITCYLCLIFYIQFFFPSSSNSMWSVFFGGVRFRHSVALTVFFLLSIVWIFGFVFGFYYHFTIVVLVVSLTAMDNPRLPFTLLILFSFRIFTRRYLFVRPICWPTNRFYQTLFVHSLLIFFASKIPQSRCSGASIFFNICWISPFDFLSLSMNNEHVSNDAGIPPPPPPIVKSCNYCRSCRCHHWCYSFSIFMLLLPLFFCCVFVSLCRCRYIVN